MQLRGKNRFRDECRRARRASRFLDVGPLVGRRDHDGHVGVAEKPANPSHRLDAVHVGHLPVHDVGPVRVALGEGGAGAQHGLVAGKRPVAAHSHRLEHVAHADGGARVVVGHEHANAAQLRDLVRLRGQGPAAALEAHHELGPAARLARHGDLPAHHVHDVLGDGHAEPSPLDAAHRGAFFPGKRLEDVLLELLGDADAGVAHAELVARPPLLAGRELGDAQRDGPARRRELDGVAQHVEEHLLQAQAVADHGLVDDVERVDEERELLGLDVGLHDGADVAHDVGQARLAFLDDDLAALDAAHVEHVVDERQEVAARHRDLLEVVDDLVFVVDVRLGERGVAHDGVHRRADVVAHAVEEGGLRAVRVLGGVERLLELLALADLLAHDVVDVVVVAAQLLAAGDVHGRAAAAHVALAERGVDPQVGVLVAVAGLHALHAVEHGLQRLGLDAAEPGVVDLLGRLAGGVARKAEELEHTGVGEHAGRLPVHELDAPRAHLGRLDDGVHGGELGASLLLGLNDVVDVAEAEHQIAGAVLVGELGGAELVKNRLVLVDAPVRERADAGVWRLGEKRLGRRVAAQVLAVLGRDELVDVGAQAVLVVGVAQRLAEHRAVDAARVCAEVGVATRLGVDEEQVLELAAERAHDADALAQFLLAAVARGREIIDVGKNALVNRRVVVCVAHGAHGGVGEPAPAALLSGQAEGLPAGQLAARELEVVGVDKAGKLEAEPPAQLFLGPAEGVKKGGSRLDEGEVRVRGAAVRGAGGGAFGRVRVGIAEGHGPPPFI